MCWYLIADICTQQLDTQEHVKIWAYIHRTWQNECIAVKARDSFYLRKKIIFSVVSFPLKLPVAESIPRQSDHSLIVDREPSKQKAWKFILYYCGKNVVYTANI